jgi:hypothetical protein
LLPDYKTSVFEGDKPVIAPFQDTVVKTAKYLKEQEFDEEAVF